MTNQTQQNYNTIHWIFVLLLGCLIASPLFLLNHLNNLNLSLEIFVALFVVVAFLIYGDKILTYLLLRPLSFFKKINYKLTNLAHQQLTIINNNCKRKSKLTNNTLVALLIFAGTIFPFNPIDDSVNKTPLELTKTMFIIFIAALTIYFAWNWIEKHKDLVKTNYKPNKKIY